ncbi:MAG TPA: hypothetical protein VN666_07335 [Nitrospira sp.]|nr:hypothetical protein [Nitrospira sp.]
MKTLGYSLMMVGMTLALGGVVAVFNFDQPSEVFSSAWWMIIGGWSLAFTGMGIDIMYVFRIVKREPVYLFQRERNTTKRIEGKITRRG